MKKASTEKVLKTYRGVFLNIEDSNICSLKYGLYFYFCSPVMKEKFERNLEDYINNIKKRINTMIPSVEIDNINIAIAIYYYSYVEKRGFRIETLHGARIKKAHLIGDVEFVEDMEE